MKLAKALAFGVVALFVMTFMAITANEVKADAEILYDTFETNTGGWTGHDGGTTPDRSNSYSYIGSYSADWGGSHRAESAITVDSSGDEIEFSFYPKVMTEANGGFTIDFLTSMGWRHGPLLQFDGTDIRTVMEGGEYTYRIIGVIHLDSWNKIKLVVYNNWDTYDITINEHPPETGIASAKDHAYLPVTMAIGSYAGTNEIYFDEIKIGADLWPQPKYAPTITHEPFLEAYVGLPYSDYFTTLNETHVIGISMPSWLSLSHNHTSFSPWTLSGHPTVEGSYNISISFQSVVGTLYTYWNETIEVGYHPSLVADLGDWDELLSMMLAFVLALFFTLGAKRRLDMALFLTILGCAIAVLVSLETLPIAGMGMTVLCFVAVIYMRKTHGGA
jgi:hypothetical protein